MCEGKHITRRTTSLHFPSPAAGRRSGAARTAAVLAALVCAALALRAAKPAAATSQAVAASATPAAAPVVTLDADAGWAGLYRPGRPIPVRVTVTADRTLSATLTVTVKATNGGTTVTSLPVTTEADQPVPLVFGVAAPQDAALPVTIALDDPAGAPLAGAVVRLAPVGADEVVGALPGAAGAAALPLTVPLTPPVGLAHVVRLDPTALAAGALGPLGTVAATPADLRALDGAQRTALFAWVAGGGRLLAAGTGAEPITTLPDAWQPAGPTGHQPAALGEVWRTTADLAGGRWEGALAPTSTHGAADPALFQAGYAAAGAPSASLARQTRTALPSVAVTAAVGLGWAVLLCLLFLGLRRARRPKLAWAAAVVLAVLAAGGLVAARSSLAAGGTGQLSWRLASPGGGPAGAWLGRRSTGRGAVSLALPAGWVGGNDANSGFGAPGPPVRVTNPPGAPGSGPQATVEGAASTLASVRATGPTAPAALLTVQASASPAGVVGTVSNRSGDALDDVAVVAGGHAVSVGRVAAGATVPWHVDLIAGAAGPALNVALERTAWPVGLDPAQAPAPLDLAVWGAARRELGPQLLAPGTATAVAWSDRGSGPADGTAPAGRHAVLATAPISPPNGSLTGWDVRRVLLREDAATPNGPVTAVVAFELPPGAPPPAPLELVVPPVATQLAVWDGAGWASLPPPVPVNPVGASVPVALPGGAATEAARSGVVYVRLTVDPAAVGLTTSDFLVRSAAP